LFKIWSYQVHNQVTSASHDILLWFLCSPFLSNQHFLRKIKPFTAEILVHQRTVDKTTNDQNWFLKARGNRGKPIVLQFAPHKQADTSQLQAEASRYKSTDEHDEESTTTGKRDTPTLQLWYRI